MILKLRWSGILAMFVTNRDNFSNTIITCFVLHNFCWINGEEYLEINGEENLVDDT